MRAAKPLLVMIEDSETEDGEIMRRRNESKEALHLLCHMGNSTLM